VRRGWAASPKTTAARWIVSSAVSVCLLSRVGRTGVRLGSLKSGGGTAVPPGGDVPDPGGWGEVRAIADVADVGDVSGDVGDTGPLRPPKPVGDVSPLRPPKPVGDVSPLLPPRLVGDVVTGAGAGEKRSRTAGGGGNWPACGGEERGTTGGGGGGKRPAPAGGGGGYRSMARSTRAQWRPWLQRNHRCFSSARSCL